MITLIVNPAAGNGRAKNVASSAVECLKEKNVPYRLWETQAPHHATELAAQAAAEYDEASDDLLISIGGDGTFLEVVQGLLPSKLPLASLPAGTGNDFLKSLSVPSDPMEALAHILEAKPRLIDVGAVNGRLFANECGVGFDVAVLDYANKAKKHLRGLAPYLLGVFKALFTFRSLPLEVRADGEEVFSGDCLVVSVANGQYIGGGIHISPEADPASGKLELIVIKKCSFLRKCSYVPGLLSGKILQFKDTVVHCRANSISLLPLNGALRVNIDGEICNHPECNFAIQPKALRIHM